MANTTFYNRGDAYHDSAGNTAIIKRGNELTFTEHFNAGGGGDPYTPPVYSLEEVNTGEKWVDGKDIYRRGFVVGKFFANSFVNITTMETLGAEKLIDSILLAGSHAEYPIEHVDININGGSIRFQSAHGDSSTQDTNYVFLKYTKTTPTLTTTRTTAKKTSKKG